MKVLITGGAGYVGYSLISSLINHSEISNIIIYDNFYKKQYASFISGLFQNKKIKVVNGDILDRISLKKALNEVDTVVHLAAIAYTPFANIDHHQFDQINNWGTAQVVEACREMNIKNFIYSSSASVYGHCDLPAAEIEETIPDSFYGISKLAGEKHVSTLENSTDVSILRIGLVYGLNPCMKMEGVIHKFLFDSAVSGKISIDGNGQQKRPFIHVETVSNYISSVITGKEKPEVIQNLFTQILSIDEIANYLKNTLPRLDIIFVNQDHQFGNLIIAENKITKSLREIGLNNLNIANFFSNYFTN